MVILHPVLEVDGDDHEDVDEALQDVGHVPGTEHFLHLGAVELVAKPAFNYI